MALIAKHPHGWRKRSVLLGALAMLIGAAVAFDLTPAPVLYRLALGLDLVIVAALGVLFIRLSRMGMSAE